MYVKIHSKHNKSLNTGSAKDLMKYLSKENNDKNIFDQEHFFNQHSSTISENKALSIIDGNKGRLSKDETKFYMVTVNPSQKELAHIGNDNEKLKEYTNQVMDEYAKNFNRFYDKENPETQLRGSDLVYFAKLENSRHYKYDNSGDRELINFNSNVDKLIKQAQDQGKSKNLIRTLEKSYKRDGDEIVRRGGPKGGDNRHVHIVISRYDQQQKFKLSPMSNARSTKNQTIGKEGESRKVKAGFDREKFVDSVETKFDKTFDYKRQHSEKWRTKQQQVNLNKGLVVIHALSNPQAFAKAAAKRAMIQMVKNKTLQKSLGMATANPKQLPKKVLRNLEKEAIKAVMTSVGAASYAHPVTAAVNIAKKTITIAARAIAKGYGI